MPGRVQIHARNFMVKSPCARRLDQKWFAAGALLRPARFYSAVVVSLGRLAIA